MAFQLRKNCLFSPMIFEGSNKICVTIEFPGFCRLSQRRHHRRFWPSSLKSNVQIMLLHFVTFARRGSRKFDRTNVFAGAAGKNLFAVVHARHVHLQTLLARELFGTYLTEKGGKIVVRSPEVQEVSHLKSKSLILNNNLFKWLCK